MTRIVILVAMAAILTGCAALRSTQAGVEIRPPDRPEQFEFILVPGSGPGTLADRLAARLVSGDPIEDGSADHLAGAETPIGRLDLVSLRLGEGSQDMAGSDCIGATGQSGGSMTCGVDPEAGVEGINGWSSDGMWNDTFMVGPIGTATMVVTTSDGTKYTIRTFDRWGLLVWAAIHGDLISIIYLDANDEPIES